MADARAVERHVPEADMQLDGGHVGGRVDVAVHPLADVKGGIRDRHREDLGMDLLQRDRRGDGFGRAGASEADGQENREGASPEQP